MNGLQEIQWKPIGYERFADGSIDYNRTFTLSSSIEFTVLLIPNSRSSVLHAESFANHLRHYSAVRQGYNVKS